MSKLPDQRGLTLMEVLAAVTITSIISVLIYGILFNSKEQYNTQTEKNEQLSDMSYALKVITKDLRKSGTAPEINLNTIKIGEEEYVFNTSLNSISRNGVELIQHIIDFKIEPITENKYKILIKNTRENVDTEIVIRSEH
ncbi:PilW family protein [Lysinibacillus sp. NPDC048646]|uniref:PilW family protein n=1 Tax=Lysinibacillus sp. NPDC048646 TaxID=3390574 RepID=UPI003D04FFBC